jgi:hypothetical protein
MIKLLLTTLYVFTAAYDIIGWYIQNSGCNNKMNITTFPFEHYTHVVTSSPIVLENGTAICNTTDTFLQAFVARANLYKSKLMWRDGMPAENLRNVILNDSWVIYKNNYLNSINYAVTLCNVSGIEFDYEPINGFVTEEHQLKYSTFLASMKIVLGEAKQIGACMGVPSFFPLMVRSRINVSMVNAGGIDYVNVMSYHYSNELMPWKVDAFVLTKLWGILHSLTRFG